KKTLGEQAPLGEASIVALARDGFPSPSCGHNTRPEEEIARDVAAADPAPDGGDGAAPPDPDEAFRAFAAGVAPGWLAAPRDRISSPGPVPSSRFA
ncbi:hypothetical protein ACFCYM_06895, partial [Streptomyces sp. NPDC056254]